MEIIQSLFFAILHIILHPDQAMLSLAQSMGTWLYVLLFLILFAETGLVITPFLPGDSLLFALGAMTSLTEGGLSLTALLILLPVAVFIGDNLNYFIGKKWGSRLFEVDANGKDRPFFNRRSLAQAQAFYEKHGSRAVVIARFIPIVRTFVPFVAGLGQMQYKRFLVYSVLGSLLWIPTFLFAGRVFGNLPAVKSNFHLVVFGVIFLSIAPVIFAFVRGRLRAGVDAKESQLK